MPASHIFLILLQKRLHIDVDQTMYNSANIWNFQKKGLLPTDLYTGSEKVPKIFGSYRKSPYLCNVKCKFDYPGDIPARGKPLSTLPI